MEKEEIHLYDTHRLLFGQMPPEILIETLVRSFILYSVLLFVVRLLGKRTNSLMTITERAVFITLGAIVALPMHGPDRGIIIGVVILLVVLVLQRGLTYSFFISRRWEEAMQGTVQTLVKDGIINIAILEKFNISRQQLFELLRENKIRHLGQVKRAYTEACGTFSLYQNEKAVPGLSILPVDDVGTIITAENAYSSCTWCGNTVHIASPVGKCPNCEHEHWVKPSNEFVKYE